MRVRQRGAYQRRSLLDSRVGRRRDALDQGVVNTLLNVYTGLPQHRRRPAAKSRRFS
jgi:hypothetical protein